MKSDMASPMPVVSSLSTQNRRVISGTLMASGCERSGLRRGVMDRSAADGRQGSGGADGGATARGRGGATGAERDEAPLADPNPALAPVARPSAGRRRGVSVANRTLTHRAQGGHISDPRGAYNPGHPDLQGDSLDVQTLHARCPRGHRGDASHVLLISVDGLHQSDLRWYVRTHPDSELAWLVNRGAEYS